MEKETHPQLEAVAAQLAKEITYTHDAIMAVHKFAEDNRDPMVQMNCMKLAASMMQAQAAAALSLQRLSGSGPTFTFIHEKRYAGDTPTPQKSKTNRRRPTKGYVEELWEDEDGNWNTTPPDSAHAQKDQATD